MTNIVIATELKEIEEAVQNFIKDHKEPVAADIKGFDAQIAKLQDKSRDRTYDMVAALVDLAEMLGVDAPTPGYESFLVDRAVTKPGKNHNPYMAFIKAVFSVRGADKRWAFLDRSVEKHANHVRFLVNAKRKGLIEGRVQDFIKSYPEKLKGIEAQDRADHPNKAQADRVETVRSRGLTAAARATISETFSAKEGDWMKVYGRVRDGKLELLHGEVVSNDDQKNSILYKIGNFKAAA